MKQLIRAGAAALASSALVLAAAGTASAEVVRVNDARGDVWKMPDNDRQRAERVGSTLNGDIDKTRVDHGFETLTITTTYERLAKRKVAFQAWWVIRTDAGNEYNAYTYAQPRGWRGEHGFFDASQASPRLRLGVPAGEEPCADMTHKVSYRNDTVSVTIPRTCLADAAWVKVKSLHLSARRSSERIRVDNGHVEGHSFRGWTDRVASDAVIG